MPAHVPIIVLVWENWSDTKLLLESLLKAEINAPIWLVDNGSTNIAPFQDIKNTFPLVRYFRLDMNYGFAGGMNRALKLAHDEGFKMAYAINNDCLVTNDFLSPIVKIAEALNDLAIIGSRYISRDNSGQYSIWGFHSNPLERELYKDGFLQTDRVVGCGMLIKISRFADAGGFDERFFCYGEENDLCYRLQKKGYVVGFCFDSLILHNHQGSDIRSNYIYYRTRNAYLLKSLHPNLHVSMSHPIIVIDSAYKNIKNYEVFSSYIEGLYCGLSGVFGKRNKTYNKSIIYLLFIYYHIIYFPYRIYNLIKRIVSGIIHIFGSNRARYF